MKIIYLIFFYFLIANSGNINYWNFELDFTNFNDAKTFYFWLSFQNGLPTTGFLKIVFPFDIGTTLSGNWIQNNNPCNNIQSTFPLRIIKSTLSTDNGLYSYYLEFHKFANFTQKLALEPQIIYKFYIISSVAFIPGTIGYLYLSPLELYSVSDYSEDYIIYDQNPVFSTISFASPAATTLSASLTANSFNVDLINSVELTVTNTVQINTAFQIKISINNQDFSFLNEANCKINDAAGNSIASEGFCKINTNFPNEIHFFIRQALAANTQLKYIFQLKTPLYQTTDSLSVFLMDYGVNKILEKVTSGLTITSQALQWSASSITIGPGLAPSPIFSIYTSGPLQRVYNTLHCKFQPSQNSPSSNYKLLLKFGSTAHLLPSSFSQQNLPSASQNNTLTCKIYTSYLECENLGQLLATTTYTISIKLYIDYQYPPILHADFTKIYLLPKLSNSLFSESKYTFQPINLSGTVSLKNNLDRVYTDATSSEALHSKLSQINSLASSLSVKYLSSQVSQTLAFRLKTELADFTSDTLTATSGIDIYMPAKIVTLASSFSQSNSNCYSLAFGFTNNDLSVCDIRTIMVNNVEMLRLRMGISSIALGNQVWDHGATFNEFGFNNLVVKEQSSLSADRSFDVFIGCVKSGLSTTESNLNYTAVYLVNSFTISGDSSNLFDVKLTHFWTSTSGSGRVSGAYFPCVMRIFGSASGMISAGSSGKIVVMFDQLEFFEENAEAYSRTVNCTGTSTAVCLGYKGHSDALHFSYFNFIELSFTSFPSQAQFIIPFATINKKKIINGAIAELSSSNTMISIKKFTLDMSLAADQSTIELLNSAYEISGANYGLSSSTNKVGSIGTGTISVHHTDPYNLFNSNYDNLQGAAFLFVTSWDFGSASYNPNFQNNSQFSTCYKFSYLYLSSVKHVLWCSIDTNLSQTSAISVSSFNYPYISGTSLPITYGAISTNNGLLLHYESTQKDSALSPAELSWQTPALEGSLVLSHKNTRIGFKFTTNTIIPINSILEISTSNSESFFFVADESAQCALSKDNYDSAPIQNCIQFYKKNSFEASEFSIGNYTLFFNGITVVEEIPRQTQQVTLNIMTNKRTLISQANQYLTISFLAQNSVLQPELAVLYAYSTFPIADSLTSLFISFQIKNRKLFSSEQVIFDINPLIAGTLLQSSVDSHSVSCQILFPNNSVSFQWKSCSKKDFATKIALTPNSDISENSTFLLKISPVRLASKTTALDLGYSLLVVQPNLFVFNKKYKKLTNYTKTHTKLEYPNIILTKKDNSLGIPSTFLFKITLKHSVLNNDSIISIQFPSYYIGLISENCYVSVNSQKLFFFLNEEQINITYQGSNILPNNTFNLQIAGVPVPRINSTTIQSIFLTFFNKTSPQSITEAGSVNDLLYTSPTSIKNLSISLTSATTYKTGSLSSFTFHIIPFSTTPSSRQLSIKFSNSFNYLNFLTFSPICSFAVYPTTTFINITCSFQNQILSTNLPFSLAITNTYILKIDNIVNPYIPICFLPKTTGFISSSDGNSAEFADAVSNPGFNNFSALETASWSYSGNSIVFANLHYILPIHKGKFLILFLIGTFSKLVYIHLQSNTRTSTSSFFTLNSNSIDCEIYPKTLKVGMGEKGAYFRIGCSEKTSPGLYQVFLQLAPQNPVFYLPPPPITLDILKDPSPLNSSSTSQLQIPFYGLSHPLNLSLDDSPPFDNLSLSLRFGLSPYTNLNYQTNDTLFLTKERPFGYFILQSTFVTNSLLKTSNLNYFLYNNNNYKIALANPTAELVDFPLTNTTIQFTLVQSSQHSATVSISSSHPLTVYCHVYISYSKFYFFNKVSEKEQVKSNAISMQKTSESKLNYQQFHIWNVQANAISNKTFYSLLSGVNYTVVFYPENLMQQSFTSQTLHFFTEKKNNQKTLRTKITFQNTANGVVLENIICYLCRNLYLAPLKIFSQEGIYCPDGAMSNSEYFLENTYSYLYFYPYNDKDYSDDTVLEINNTISNNNTLISLVNNQILNNSGNSVTKLEILGETNKQKIEFLENINIQGKNGRILISNIKLNGTGFVWAIANKMGNKDEIKRIKQFWEPTPQEIVKGVNGSHLKANGRAFLLYDYNSPQNSVSITGLENDKVYRVYVVSSDEDPSYFAHFSQIVKSDVVTFAKNLVLNLIILLVASGLLLIIN